MSLTRRNTRAAALQRLTRRARRTKQAIPLDIVDVWLRRAFLPICVAGGLYGILSGHRWDHLVIGLGAAFAIQLISMAALLALYFSYTWVMSGVDALRGGRRATLAQPTMSLLPSDTASAGAQIFEGVVRAGSSLRSPLAHRDCVAYRLVGQGPLGKIDEGAATTFELELANGSRMRVEADPCAVDLPVSDSPRALRPSPELNRFLEDRGAYPSRGPLHLAEALIVDGDSVVVSGAAIEDTTTDGYRERREQLVLRETAETAMTIRRVENDIQ